MRMRLNLGAPYEQIIKKVITKEYATNHTEVIRLALLNLDRKLENEEVMLVNKGIEAARKKRKENNEELIPMEQVLKECD